MEDLKKMNENAELEAASDNAVKMRKTASRKLTENFLTKLN